MKTHDPDPMEFDEIEVKGDPAACILHLYVAGLSHKSIQAIASIKKLCVDHMECNYELVVIDIFERPDLTRQAHIMATPTLIRILPLPLRRLVGDMTETDRILRELDL